MKKNKNAQNKIWSYCFYSYYSLDGGLCDELHKHHYVSENYKESVFRREKIMATDLGNNIAIPHGSEKEIIKSKIVIATLKKLFYGINIKYRLFLWLLWIWKNLK